MIPLALIPIIAEGIISLFSRIIGPLAAESHSPIISAIGSLASSAAGLTTTGIMGVLESYMSGVTAEKRMEFQLELNSLLGSIELDLADANSEHFIQYGWRPFIAWGMGSNLVFHYTLQNLIDTLNSLVGTHIADLPSMDNMALVIICGLLGIYMTARTVEKLND